MQQILRKHRQMGEFIGIHERRGTTRQRVPLSGHIGLPDTPPHSCTIHDLSMFGACVTAPDVALPNWFILKIGNGRAQRTCEVIWRKEFTVGVRFVTMSGRPEPIVPEEDRAS